MIRCRIFRLCFASVVLGALGAARAQDGMLVPPAAMALDSIPPIPASIAADVGRYIEYKPAQFASWHPRRLEMLVARRHGNTTQIHRLAAPGSALEPLTDSPEPVRSAAYHPVRGDAYLFVRDSGGNEVFRLYRGTLDGKAPMPISTAGRRVQDFSWSHRGDRVVYATVPVDRKGTENIVQTDVHVARPGSGASAAGSDRVVAQLPGGGWFGLNWSPDDRRIALLEFISANESHIWLMDPATGARRRLTDARANRPVFYGETRFSRNGRGLYAVTDRDSEFRKLVYIDLSTRKHAAVSASIPWDIDDFDLSRDGSRLAFVSNEDGASVLHLVRTRDGVRLPSPTLPLGVVSGLSWHRDSVNLAFTVSAARHPAEAYSLDTRTGRLTRWTYQPADGADPSAFAEPKRVRWPSFDAMQISGFLYHAPAPRYAGKRPLLINIHGGPEAQFRPGFLGRINYVVNELGVSVLYPNVRGSTGFGKTFLKLDNGRLREDSVKDIGALFDWIAAQPDLDASRVMVAGASYGGYMSLAAATLYPERIAAAIDVVGISNFVTFLERTESYRRDLRRMEYGDERDPEMRRFLESISPLNRADRIRKPLLVVQGRNDPRVPVTEAEQIVATLKRGATPVWYLVANDEGHGFAKKANADFQFYVTVAFLRRYLLSAN